MPTNPKTSKLILIPLFRQTNSRIKGRRNLLRICIKLIVKEESITIVIKFTTSILRDPPLKINLIGSLTLWVMIL
jgi:hypothetical protein